MVTVILATAVIAAAIALGAVSLLAFLLLLLMPLPPLLTMASTPAARLAIDGLLSLGFFLQHSGMIRHSVQDRFLARVPAELRPALYAIASAVMLLLVVVCWQPTVPFLVIDDPLCWLLRGLSLTALAGMAWGMLAIGSFDAFGIRPILASLYGQKPDDLPLTVRGPYRWVRHPLYTCVLLLLWSQPVLSADRLLLATTWTIWIVIGAVLEERDLVAAFGEPYRQYQQQVPMLLPWRLPE